ncbi:hypothetical protein [Hymenobacter cellulosivorans]|uniref:Uncharacterized protein n=1 Tax=Hymenobacter cellulosivorans TaxID=2932249 RepID=A0ABY4F3Q0_9BACT|nr:hypothetical protein [Hymenobacter cellulosivorans]UOQ50851.1 hypothetical protein MUN80_13895 [Hymenobacter cellulosivorans]
MLSLSMLFLMGCQPTANSVADAALGNLRQEIARKNDSLVLLTSQLAQAQALTPTTTSVVAAAAVPVTAVADDQPTPQLYRQPVITPLSTELAEVLSLIDSTTTFAADNYSIRASRACNGPSDQELDYCNCSNFIYLSLDTYNMPYEYKAYRIGPFYEAEFKGWKGTKARADLQISHNVKGQKRVNTFRISWAGVQQL